MVKEGGVGKFWLGTVLRLKMKVKTRMRGISRALLLLDSTNDFEVFGTSARVGR